MRRGGIEGEEEDGNDGWEEGKRRNGRTEEKEEYSIRYNNSNSII